MEPVSFNLEHKTPHDDKYIVFKRQEFEQNLSGLPKSVFNAIALPDAVVIRRQDLFASPALHGYANSIGIAIALTDDEVTRKRLQGVADYFHQQGEAASEEAAKLPD